jgi:hypothetical protein
MTGDAMRPGETKRNSCNALCVAKFRRGAVRHLVAVASSRFTYNVEPKD